MKSHVQSLVAMVVLGTAGACGAAADLLPSWNGTAPKEAIVAFVEKITKAGSTDVVPVSERIAVFDNDGTLWAEQPLDVQFVFMLDQIKAAARRFAYDRASHIGKLDKAWDEAKARPWIVVSMKHDWKHIFAVE